MSTIAIETASDEVVRARFSEIIKAQERVNYAAHVMGLGIKKTHQKINKSPPPKKPVADQKLRQFGTFARKAAAEEIKVSMELSSIDEARKLVAAARRSKNALGGRGSYGLVS